VGGVLFKWEGLRGGRYRRGNRVYLKGGMIGVQGVSLDFGVSLVLCSFSGEKNACWR